MNNTDFRYQIKILIAQKGISIPQLSRLVGLNQQTIYNFIQGKSQMTSSNLEKLFDALKTIKK